METTQIKESSAEAILKKTKLCKIEDIFKVKKLLYGFGDTSHLAAITTPEDVFDDLYELELWELNEMEKHLSREASIIAWSLTKDHRGNINYGF